MLLEVPSEDLFLSFITDVHLSARPPGRRMDDYKEAIFRKLQMVQEWTTRSGGLCVCGGDFFHIKNSKSPANSLEMLNQTIDLLSTFPSGGIYGIVGNHDVQYDRVSTLDEQPLGILVHAGVYRVFNNLRIKTSTGMVVEILGFDTGNELDVLDKILKTPKRDDGVDYRIGVAHAMARPGGVQEMHGHPIIGYDLLEDIDFDCFLWGHDHSRVEPTEVGICTHFHPGSLSRAALSQDEVDRKVTVLGLKFTEDGWGFKEREVPTTPLEAAFRVADKKIQKANESTEVQGFVSEMSDSIGSIEVSDPRAVIEGLCGDDTKLKELILDVCEL